MKFLCCLLLFLLPIVGLSQDSPYRLKGEVFSPFKYPKKASLEVTRSLYGLRFKDEFIPKVYKDAVETFFKKSFRSKYDRMGKYSLQLEIKGGYLYIEGIEIIEAPLE
ncbi:hypothetical protein [Psychroflexus sp. ALD_RP9]|uniref:hypothetical protein n=1 Tax=Psychroflexus sp. ALD_RP9 TaxID=2777186 RepID=UPI001A90C3CA|nr:hypothetical protein [Psychroflexus sp. ALD_RP9]